jgi:hypothetical protein
LFCYTLPVDGICEPAVGLSGLLLVSWLKSLELSRIDLLQVRESTQSYATQLERKLEGRARDMDYDSVL